MTSGACRTAGQRFTTVAESRSITAAMKSPTWESDWVSGTTEYQEASAATGGAEMAAGGGAGAARTSTTAARAACQASSMGGTASTADRQASRRMPSTPWNSSSRSCLSRSKSFDLFGDARSDGAKRIAPSDARRRIAERFPQRGIDCQRPQAMYRSAAPRSHHGVPAPTRPRVDANRPAGGFALETVTAPGHHAVS